MFITDNQHIYTNISQLSNVKSMVGMHRILRVNQYYANIGQFLAKNEFPLILFATSIENSA